ncbi:hypothetical protein ASG91_14780 [Phycicoccus sp. Soil802]|nr:hypothetical protein ASG91_14780 [Phycicoccus sp. Soil802]
MMTDAVGAELLSQQMEARLNDAEATAGACEQIVGHMSFLAGARENGLAMDAIGDGSDAATTAYPHHPEFAASVSALAQDLIASATASGTSTRSIPSADEVVQSRAPAACLELATRAASK